MSSAVTLYGKTYLQESKNDTKMGSFIKDFISYNWGTVNKQVYIKLAEGTNVDAFRVYRLSKGCKARSRCEFEVLRQLIEKKVLSGIKYKYRHL